MKRILSLCTMGALVIAVLAMPASAADFGSAPHRLTDNPSDVDDRAAFGTKLIFSQYASGVQGVWISDGSAAGTKQIVGVGASPTPTDPSDFTVWRGKVYFQAMDPAHGEELWVTDGTNAGTTRVTDINSGAGDANPRELTVAGANLYFAASASAGHETLYRISPPPAIGPPAPPAVVFSAAGFTGILNLAAVGDKVAFNGFTTGSGQEPWASDGSSGGTVKLKEIVPAGNGSAPGNFTALGSTIFFTADDGVHGVELWRSDGTSGTATMVKDLNPGAANSNPTGLYASGDQLLFAASDATGHEIWASDGTAGHTQILQRIWGGGSDGNPPGFTAYKGWVYFSGYTGSSGAQLWRTQGSTLNTQLFKTINPGNSNASPQGFTIVDGKMYFSAKDAAHGAELWSTDGTTSGTVRISDINPGPQPAYPESFVGVGNTLFFAATEPVHLRQLYAYTTRSSTTKASPKSSYSHSAGAHRTIKVSVKVTASGTTPTGTVQLRMGSSVIGSGTLSSSGKVSVHITSKLGKGSHHVKAYYLGSVKARASHSSTFSVKVK